MSMIVQNDIEKQSIKLYSTPHLNLWLNHTIRFE